MTEFRLGLYLLNLSAYQQYIVTLAKDVQGNYTKSLQFSMCLSKIQTGKLPDVKKVKQSH